MSSELSTSVREALRAGDIDAADLLRPDLLRPVLRLRTPQRRARLSAALAVVAAVVVLALLPAMIASHHGRSSRGATGGSSISGAVGYRWRLTQLVDSQGKLSASSARPAQIGFTRDGYVLGDDTVNALQGIYHLEPGGYRVTDSASSAAGTTGGDPMQERTTRAVDDMFISTTTSLTDTPPPVMVQASRQGDTLTLHRGAVTLTLRRAGDQPDFFAQTPTPTATR